MSIHEPTWELKKNHRASSFDLWNRVSRTPRNRTHKHGFRPQICRGVTRDRRLSTSDSSGGSKEKHHEGPTIPSNLISQPNKKTKQKTNKQSKDTKKARANDKTILHKTKPAADKQTIKQASKQARYTNPCK